MNGLDLGWVARLASVVAPYIMESIYVWEALSTINISLLQVTLPETSSSVFGGGCFFL